MPIESAADFSSYVNTTGHGVKATYFESGKLFDDFPLIDSLGLIDDGLSTIINLIIDQDYVSIAGGSVNVTGFKPQATLKISDAPNIQQEDTIIIEAITTNKGSTLVPETTYRVINVQPDNVGMVNVILEVQ